MSKPCKVWGNKRFEREYNNSLWQADFKLCDDDYWMISYQDVHSRLLLVRLRFGILQVRTLLNYLTGLLVGMVCLCRFLLIKEHSLNLQEVRESLLLNVVV
jgi:hypothetical protein